MSLKEWVEGSADLAFRSAAFPGWLIHRRTADPKTGSALQGLRLFPVVEIASNGARNPGRNRKPRTGLRYPNPSVKVAKATKEAV
jgi:hypothetical protein